jgi:hypothetical protein
MIAAQKTHYSPRFASISQAEHFHSAEEAWFWTMAALTARHDGARIVAGKGDKLRPCEPDDVVKCLDRLYRHRRIDLTHARILRIWGERGAAPDARQPAERRERRGVEGPALGRPEGWGKREIGSHAAVPHADLQRDSQY